MDCPALKNYDNLEAKYHVAQKEIEQLRETIRLFQLHLIPEKLIMTVTKDGKELKIYETRKIPSIAKQRDLVKQFMQETK